MDVIEFCEDYLNIKLYSWQKEFVKNSYAAYKEGKQFYYFPPRGGNKRNLMVLQAAAILKAYEDEKECTHTTKT